jgi:hypothetical protein
MGDYGLRDFHGGISPAGLVRPRKKQARQVVYRVDSFLNRKPLDRVEMPPGSGHVMYVASHLILILWRVSSALAFQLDAHLFLLGLVRRGRNPAPWLIGTGGAQ